MELDLYMKLKKDKRMYDILKQNSYWLKLLNRNPDNYKLFENEMKERYKLRTSDKLNEVIDNIDLISAVLETLN